MILKKRIWEQAQTEPSMEEKEEFNPEEDAIFNTGEDIIESYINFIKKNKKYIKLGKDKYNEDNDSRVKFINETLGCDIFETDIEEIKKRIEELKGVGLYIAIQEEISILGENISAIVLEEKDHML